MAYLLICSRVRGTSWVGQLRDQMRPQGTGHQFPRMIRFQDVLLGQRLGMGVMAKPLFGIGSGLVLMNLMLAVEGHAGAAGAVLPGATQAAAGPAAGLDALPAVSEDENSADGERGEGLGTEVDADARGHQRDDVVPVSGVAETRARDRRPPLVVPQTTQAKPVVSPLPAP